MTGISFSLLMTVYRGDTLEHFNEAFNSIWFKQTVRPNEIILVQDGPVDKALSNKLIKLNEEIAEVILIVLSNNQGLASALNIGIERCSHQFIARMDSDDISTPDRFAKQLDYLCNNPSIDILGGQVQEFGVDRLDILHLRQVPTTHDEILRLMKWRCALSHPSVMYRKSLLDSLGGYSTNIFPEDYHLWVRALMYGARMGNLEQTILYFRIGNIEDFSKRRSGLNYAIKEVRMLYSFYTLGFINFGELSLRIVIRSFIRLLPSSLFKLVLMRVGRGSKALK